MALATGAFADPKPTEIDSKPFRDRLLVFQDAQGGTYALLRDSSARLFYGTGKLLYEQFVIGGSSDGEQNTWSVDTWTPRLPEIHRGSLQRTADGTYRRWCDGLDDAGVTEVTGDKAKQLISSVKLMTHANERIAYLLARDDTGVYYYVDRIRGGQAYRVYVGKKGAMKLLPLSDVAIDMAGAVFSTKTGDLRLVTSADNGGAKVKWVHGDKNIDLHYLDVDASSPLIFKELGIYGFLGSLCDNA